MADHCSLYLTIHACPRAQIRDVLDVLEEYDLENEKDSPVTLPAFQLGATYWNYSAPLDSANEIASALASLPGVAFDVHDEPERDGLGTSVMHTPALGSWYAECTEGGEEVFNADQITTAIGAGTVEQLLGQPWRQALATYHAPPTWLVAPELRDASWVVTEGLVEISGGDDADGVPIKVHVAGEKEADARAALAVAGWTPVEGRWRPVLRGRAYELEVFRTDAS